MGASNSTMCSSHTTQNITFFCTQCNQAICNICVSSNHQSHKIDQLDVNNPNQQKLLDQHQQNQVQTSTPLQFQKTQQDNNNIKPSETPTEKKQAIKIKYEGTEIYLHRDGVKIPDGTTDVAIGRCDYLPNFPRSVESIYLIDRFNQDIYQLPATIGHLSLFDVYNQIKYIPNGITSVSFCNGFSGNISRDMIPRSVKYLSFYNICGRIEDGAIPPTVDSIRKSPLCPYRIEGYVPFGKEVDEAYGSGGYTYIYE